MTQQRIQIDEIGTLFNDLVMAGEAAIVPAAEPMPGWHVNATHPVPGWGAWRVTPSTPRRVFDGGETVFYTFADRAEYLAALGATDLTIMPSAPVPAVVTMRQARLALLGAGLLASVDAATLRSLTVCWTTCGSGRASCCASSPTSSAPARQTWVG